MNYNENLGTCAFTQLAIGIISCFIKQNSDLSSVYNNYYYFLLMLSWIKGYETWFLSANLRQVHGTELVVSYLNIGALLWSIGWLSDGLIVLFFFASWLIILFVADTSLLVYPYPVVRNVFSSYYVYFFQVFFKQRIKCSKLQVSLIVSSSYDTEDTSPPPTSICSVE